MTVTENVQRQKRFFCENCKREVFLSNKFCDGCGGEIQWPEQVQKVLSNWTQKKRKLAFPSIFGRPKSK